MWKKLFYINPNLRNISDTIFSDVSLSFLPYISTNRLLSINTVTKYSFNILAGYSKGIDIFELGGLVNIDNGNVKYGQIGGLGNIVAGEFTGGQVGGIFNINSKNITGVQIAGIVNVDKSNIRGLQIGGIGNVVSNNTTGVQIGGVFNLTKNQFKGVQLAGIYNFTDTLKGLQLAGIINSVNTSNGIQVAGILNHSTLLNGVQFSLLNFSDTATASGIPFGLFSYVKNGYHKLELATDELLFGTLSFGTGVDRLYNIFITGINYSKPTFYTFGYGLGSNYHLKNKWSLSINLTAGVLLWPVVFIMTDIINEYYGMKGVRFLSYLTAGLIVFAFLVFYGAMQLAPADFFITSKQGSGVPDMSKAYNSVLGQGGFIIIGSLTAFILGQLIDVFVFHKIKKATGEKRIWLRATGSTLVSQFIDSFVVLFIAFYIGTRVNASANDYVWPFGLFIAVGLVNYIYKFIVALLLTPVIYLVHGWIENYLGHEKAEEMKKAAMESR